MLKEFRSIDIYWDKATREIYEEIRTSSSDEKGRKLTVQVVNDGQVQDLTGATLNLYWEFGDNQGLDSFTTLDAENGIFELYFTTGMLANIGKHKAHLHLIDLTGAITSEIFSITVFEGIDAEAMASGDEMSTLTRALVEVQNIKQAEVERVANEEQRTIAEQERIENEQARATNEGERVNAESTRTTAENTRNSNETTRANAEQARVTAETERVTAETARVSAEEERAEGYPALDTRLTAVEQNIDLLTDKVQGFSLFLQFTNGAVVVPMSELGNEAPNKYIWQASILRSISAGTLAIAIEPVSTALNLYLRTMDNAPPANAVYAVHLLRYG